ncbi:ATP-dependent RNA helicase HrpA [Yimella sp. cx-573]|nr:ATP-dependent RNA helicase HrpA [Yimella sp. cx-573]
MTEMTDKTPAKSRRRRPSSRSQERRRMSPQQVEHRRSLVPEVTYPDLPVVEAKDDIAAAIRDHQVVVIAGETGSGKTTQIPKICLELGRGVEGVIGHTQPRRLAARSVAERIAEELHTELGEVVGYQVRFTDTSSAKTLVKVMTDGILLSGLQHDRMLSQYDTIIIDEAHERSLNIDFILGYLKQLLPRRPDLKVIITSATIDPQRFADHFATPARPVPIIEVSGRTYPVEVRYRPLEREVPGKAADAAPTTVDIDQVAGIVDAVEELWSEPVSDGGPQDILVFCSGEREIRDAADALQGLNLPGTQVLPLYARLSAAEQHRIFTRHEGRRIVLATNVAETSLTVPGIRYVVDTGTARISRYSQRTKVQRLPIEPISQASAKQRTGRCGRLADGVCIRLYSQDDYEARPEFTDPEILRTNLASVILQMISLGLGDISGFPFVQPPDARQIADGLRLLDELHAIEDAGPGRRKRLTADGRAIAALPVDPRLARMIVEASRNGSLREVLPIVAAMSIQDPRERPADAQTQADQHHARFKHENSDFLTVLNLWRYLREQQKALSGSAFRRMCKAEYLHYLRVREWQDLHGQLRDISKRLKLSTSDNDASDDTVHQALLTGLLSHVGLRDRDSRDYLGARNARFGIQPGSVLFRAQPDWVMAGELVETTRLWARTNARIDPAWVENAAEHLLRRSYSDPRWEKKQAQAICSERVTLYGVPLAAGRPVSFGRIDQAYARELFIRHALVEGEWQSHHRFLRDNRALLREVAELEERTRRRDLVVDDGVLFEFYDERLPDDIVSGAHFDRWWKTQARKHPTLLNFTRDFLLTDDAGDLDVSDFPKEWHQGDLTFRLSYQFDPGSDADGVTVHLPVEQLNQVQDAGFDWLVPGVREELVTALLKSLPKATRKHFVPTPDHARAAVAQMNSASGEDLVDALSDALFARSRVRVPRDEWDWSRVPNRLRMTFRVEGKGGKKLAQGKELPLLQQQLQGSVRQAMSSVGEALERNGIREWGALQLQDRVESKSGGRTVVGYPALVDDGTSVALTVLPTPSERDHATHFGVRRLVLLATDVPWNRILSLLTNRQKLALAHHPHPSRQALHDDILAAAVDAIIERELPGGRVRDAAQFEHAKQVVKQQVVPEVIAAVDLVGPCLDAAREVRLALDRLTSPAVADLRRDLEVQYAALIHPGFVADTGVARLRRVQVYLRAMLERIEKAPGDLARDQQRQGDVDHVRTELDKLLAALPAARHTDPDVVALRWMIEELRVSLFAQKLGTAGPVSIKRIFKAMDEVEAGGAA